MSNPHNPPFIPHSLLNATFPVASPTDTYLPISSAHTLPLKDAFGTSVFVGATLSQAALRNRSPLEVKIATGHFNAFSPENSLKPIEVQPEEGHFTFDEGDRLVELAEQNGALAVGHTLVWHAQTPRWFFTDAEGKPAGRALALKRMRTHIQAVMGRYKGRIAEWDVVNEAISDGPETLRDSPWMQAIGPDYVAEAFHTARTIDSSALLIYNDYNIELSYKRPKTLRFLRELLEDGVPIDAVGIQGHWRLDTTNFAEVEQAIEEYAALGLKVQITELDLSVLPGQYEGADIEHARSMTAQQEKALNPFTAGLPVELAARHALSYRNAFEMLGRQRDHIGRITFWGTHDGLSWLNNFPMRGRTDYPLLFDRQGNCKPAFFAVRDAAFTQ